MSTEAAALTLGLDAAGFPYAYENYKVACTGDSSQDLVDRRFYPRKYDATRTLEAYASALREETDLEQSSEGLVSVVEKTVQPEHLSLWLREPDPGERR